MNAHTLFAVSICSLIAASAMANPVELTIDPAQSTLDLSVTIDIGLASDTDSDSSTLSGLVEIELDDNGNPTMISLNDLIAVIDNDLAFSWSFGFFGSADSTLSNGSVEYATAGLPTGPVPLTAGAFAFPSVLVNLNGLMEFNYDIFLAGTGSETIDLSQQGSFESPLDGDLVIDGESVTLTSSLPFDTSVPLTDADGNELGMVITVGTATIVATGTIPSCPADINGDGDLNFFDVSAFLSAFAAMDSAADFTGEGDFNFFDVSAFLTAFSVGCP